MSVTDNQNLHHTQNSLDNFFKRFINTVEARTGELPVTEYDAQWLSSCQQGKPFMSEQMQHSIHWQPFLRPDNPDKNDLAGLEKALEIRLHPDIRVFFSRYWSDHVDAVFQQGNLSLMFVWNEDDMQRLIENQLGHALNRIRNKQELTFFIACTDSDYIISITNESGQVVLERPGYGLEKVLAVSLTDFLDELEYGKLEAK